MLQISLLDRQELQQRLKLFCMNRGPPEHWLFSGIFKRLELQKALGNHLSWKDRSSISFNMLPNLELYNMLCTLILQDSVVLHDFCGKTGLVICRTSEPNESIHLDSLLNFLMKMISGRSLRKSDA